MGQRKIDVVQEVELQLDVDEVLEQLTDDLTGDELLQVIDTLSEFMADINFDTRVLQLMWKKLESDNVIEGSYRVFDCDQEVASGSARIETDEHNSAAGNASTGA